MNFNRTPITNLVFTLIAIFVTSSNTLAGGILFVDDDAAAGGDGLSWDTAYRFLQDALVDAAGGGINEIHVGRGTYTPDSDANNPDGTDDRLASFHLLNGVALMGGYAGIGAKHPDERNVLHFETILSGDLLGNDESDFVNNDENSIHVLAAQSVGLNTILDGIKVRAGNASGNKLESRRGGALRAVDSILIITQCMFERNTADLQGGALYLLGGRYEMTDCQFTGNFTSVSNGGAVCSGFASSTSDQWVRLRNSIFTGNVAYDGGGAVDIGGPHDQKVADNFEITDCTFVENNSLNAGGGALRLSGIGDHNSTNLVGFPIRGCDFIDNTAQGFGGAIWAGSVKMNLIDSRFIGNSGSLGGGVYISPDDHTPSNIVDCVFIGNNAFGSDGGGLLLARSGNSVVNCLFAWNSAADEGGGAHFSNAPGSGELTLSGCTFVSNFAGNAGGGSFVIDNGAVFSNSIFWGNGDSSGTGESAQIDTPPFRIVDLKYCCIDGWTGSSKQLHGIGIIGDDPQFVDIDGPDDIPGNEDDDLRILSGSPCIDAGNNWGVPMDANDYDEDGILCELFPVDLDGNPRFNADEADFDPGCGIPVVVDMGAYEYQFDPVDQVTFADITGDGAVSTLDLLTLFAQWGQCAKGCCLADLDIDGFVNTTDLLILFANWGTCK